MNKKTNNNILSIIFLLVLVFGLLVISNTIDNKVNDRIDFGGVDISSTNLKSILDPLPEGKFMICSFEENKCSIGIKKDLE